MKKLFSTMLVMLLGTIVHADDQSDVAEFFANHTASGYEVFCRDGVSVPECRTLISFTSNATGEQVDAFQIAFTAPVRPFAATELFIPMADKCSDGSGTYKNYADNTMDGAFKVASSAEHNVEKNNGNLTITDLPFGSLSFQKKIAVVTLANGKQISYSKLK